MDRFQPVILGGDIGAYALARELHEAFGVRSLLVTAHNPRAIQDSAILERHEFVHADEDSPLANELIRLAKQHYQAHPNVPLLLLANTDWRIDALSKHRDALERYYAMPMPHRHTIARVMNKEGFEAIARNVGMQVPATLYQDFSNADSPDWAPEPLPDEMSFPIVAKPADSSKYEHLQFAGRQKVYRIDDADELNQLWMTLRDAGFTDTFLAQQLIPGDDTAMYSVTAYVDQHRHVTMICSAQVLLEEHHPAMLGNPCAMITTPIPELLEPAKRFLESIDYHGFANFDVKRDPLTGEFYFLEVNPRIGRNSYYCVGAGINPMEVMVADVFDGAELPEQVAARESLYTIIPWLLLRKYIVDKALRSRVRRLIFTTKVVNPLRNPHDSALRRRKHRIGTEIGLAKRFREYYPKPTSTGF